MIRRRFNVPRARVPEQASELRESSEGWSLVRTSAETSGTRPFEVGKFALFFFPAQVAVKVDIDTPFAELAIIEAIAERPDIAARVDELFFEYHFNYDGLDFGWKCHIAGRCQGDVDTAVGLMRRLRQLGVRAHFWI